MKKKSIHIDELRRLMNEKIAHKDLKSGGANDMELHDEIIAALRSRGKIIEFNMALIDRKMDLVSELEIERGELLKMAETLRKARFY